MRKLIDWQLLAGRRKQYNSSNARQVLQTVNMVGIRIEADFVECFFVRGRESLALLTKNATRYGTGDVPRATQFCQWNLGNFHSVSQCLPQAAVLEESEQCSVLVACQLYCEMTS